MSNLDELLYGTVDIHAHAYPDFSLQFPNRYDLEDHVRLMRDAGMAGVVLKTHFWPSISTADSLNKKFSDFTAFGCITLNASVGGPKPWVMEAAAGLNVKVVYLPTWSAVNDQKRGGVCKLMEGYLPSLKAFTAADAYSMTGEDGKIAPEIKEIVAMAREYGMVLGTGHISPAESIEIAKFAKEIGYDKLFLTHPDSHSIGCAFEQITEFAKYGGYVELCALGLTALYYRTSLDEFKRIIDTIGPGQCIFTTDYFFDWAPSIPEQLRQMMGGLLKKGVPYEDVRTIAQNPRRLLGMDR
jgi:hypothetical protein